MQLFRGWRRNEKGFDLLFVNSFVRWREKWEIRRINALKNFTKDHSLIWRSLKSVIMREIYVFVRKFEGFRWKCCENFWVKSENENLETNIFFLFYGLFFSCKFHVRSKNIFNEKCLINLYIHSFENSAWSPPSLRLYKEVIFSRKTIKTFLLSQSLWELHQMLWSVNYFTNATNILWHKSVQLSYNKKDYSSHSLDSSSCFPEDLNKFS